MICAKIGHATRVAAQGQKVAVKSKHGRSNNLNVYRCERCDLWHMGRSRRKPVKNRERRLRFEGVDDGLV